VIDATLGRLAAGDDLTQEQMATAIGAIMEGRVPENKIALLLTALRAKGETVSEIAGAAQAMRDHMTPIRTTRRGVIDTCGTGGDGSGTFNISTAAALVTAAAGVPVAKHGNRSITSRTGSADVLAALGVNVDAPVSIVEKCINDLGICFCFAPLLHPSMKNVANVRRRLGGTTIFNLLGPLSNPAGAEFQVLGVGKPHLQPLLAQSLALLGVDRALVVSGEDGLDEVTLTGTTIALEVVGGKVREHRWIPADFGIDEAGLDDLVVNGPQESAAIIRDVLSGKPGPARDIVVLNSAAALWTARRHPSELECAEAASAAIDSGDAARLLEKFAALSKSA